MSFLSETSVLREYSEPQFCHYKDQTQQFKDGKLIKTEHVRTLAYTLSFDKDCLPGFSWIVKYGAVVYKSEPGIPWVRKDHSLLAKTRLTNAPVTFTMKGFGCAPGYYQFRRLEQHILNMLHTKGVCSCEGVCKCLETVSAMKVQKNMEMKQQQENVKKEPKNAGFKVLNQEKKKKEPQEIFEPSLTMKEQVALKHFKELKVYNDCCRSSYVQMLRNNIEYLDLMSNNEKPPYHAVFVYLYFLMMTMMFMKMFS